MKQLKRRAEFRKEVKATMPERTYEAWLAWKALVGIDSDSAAICRMADLFLLGAVGTLPAQLVGVIVEVSQSAPG
ncbi:hypothetical protein ACVCIC_04775 [Burkholderia glumae]|uniref:Uncharacterized protein n=1 Tax=Burkholderia glumae TaxID=337 RepID=A0AAP9Y154_BURGL|nr:hypothetical protein [Burkholderia glumae]AJY62658.1 hypothetical protein KS03_5036 [Burkholderia glumae LMG 2196 = ATCC 33617]KHJ60182.1 hypothetical protein NCPPB3923_25445 [Burkholderia glumae]MCM2483385.1 hypothetical protein [Burkholderia glumae]MCM2511287.1 hypothetical protein [Burkholderia glumae]MCM2541162.1 hypothetical protein [Burkholderia glumae]